MSVVTQRLTGKAKQEFQPRQTSDAGFHARGSISWQKDEE